MKRRHFLHILAATPAVAAPAVSAVLAQQPAAPAHFPPRSVFVLVHPAWHGGWCWKKVTPLLRAGGHDVFTPVLTGLGERSHLAHPMIGLETHVQDVVNVLEYEDLSGVILVGHSNAGTVITGVADRVPERLAHLVYLNAFVPEDGQATIDLLPPNVRQVLEARVRAEGYGWLLPSLQPGPWDDFVHDVWRVTDEADRRWMVARLGPTPCGAGIQWPRRCRAPTFAVYSTPARGSTAMRRRPAGPPGGAIANSHRSTIRPVTMPRELATLLLEVA